MEINTLGAIYNAQILLFFGKNIIRLAKILDVLVVSFLLFPFMCRMLLLLLISFLLVKLQLGLLCWVRSSHDERMNHFFLFYR
jgi:hypothetical protein